MPNRNHPVHLESQLKSVWTIGAQKYVTKWK